MSTIQCCADKLNLPILRSIKELYGHDSIESFVKDRRLVRIKYQGKGEYRAAYLHPDFNWMMLPEPIRCWNDAREAVRRTLEIIVAIEAGMAYIDMLEDHGLLTHDAHTEAEEALIRLNLEVHGESLFARRAGR